MPLPTATRRVRLARAAHAAIAGMGGVVATTGPGGLWRTLDGGNSIVGIVAIEGGDDRVELVLHLDAVWPPPPLGELADQVRAGVAASATTAALSNDLGDVQVFFHDVVEAIGPVGAR